MARNFALKIDPKASPAEQDRIRKQRAGQTANIEDTVDIATNETSIETNAEGIATNVTDIATNAADILALETLADGKIYVGNSSDVAIEVTPSGDVTITNTGVMAIGADKVKDSMIDWGLGAGQVNADDILHTAGESVGEIFNETLNSGLMHDCTVTDTGGLGISWIASEIWNRVANTEVETDAGSGTCTDNTTNYLVWVSGSTLTLRTTPPDNSSNEIGIARIICQDGDIWGIYKRDTIKTREYEISGALAQMFPSIVTDGLIVSEDVDATNAFDLSISTGVYYRDGHTRDSVTGYNSRATDLIRWYHSSGAWTSDADAEIDNGFWDDGTDKAAVNAAKYYAHLIFMVGGVMHVVYPNTEYNTIAQAIDGGGGTKPPAFMDSPSLMCIVLKGNDTALPTAGGTSWIDLRPLTTASVNAGIITDHGNLSGLGDDDHTQYSLVNGTRDFTGAVTVTTGNMVLSDGIIYWTKESKTATGIASVYSDTTSHVAGFQMDRYKGSIASPTTVTDATNLGEIRIRAYNGTGMYRCAAIKCYATEIHADGSAAGSKWEFQGTNAGTATRVNQIVIKDGMVRIGTGDPTNSKLEVDGSIKMLEQAAADTDEAGYGQLWVKIGTPCELWFTDDAGTDTQIV